MSRVQLPEDTQDVFIIHLDKRIGSGTAFISAGTLRIEGHYQWPPDAPAEVRCTFYFKEISDTACTVEVDWPGLLAEPIPQQEAGYHTDLILSRPQFTIHTRDGYQVVWMFTGPWPDPGIVTGIQVSVTKSDASAGVMLLFRYPPGSQS